MQSSFSMDRPRILSVDDDESIRRLLEMGLSLAGFEIVCASNATQALALVRSFDPACVILDVNMPQVDGLTLLPMVRRLTQVPIIMLTGRGDVKDRIDGLRAGADDYLAKPFDLEELAVRLRVALRRPSLELVEQITYADLRIDLAARSVTRAGVAIALSMREFELLSTLARRPKRVFTRDELLDLIWGKERAVSAQTVETFISYLRQKVDAPFERPLIRTVRGVGYTLSDS